MSRAAPTARRRTTRRRRPPLERQPTPRSKIRNRSAFNAGALLLNATEVSEAVAGVRAVPQVGAQRRGGEARLGRRLPGDGPDGQGCRRSRRSWIASGGRRGGSGRRRRRQRTSWPPAINLYNDKKYAEAAAAFEQGGGQRSRTIATRCSTWRTPTSRLKDGAKLLPTAAAPGGDRAVERDRRSSWWAKGTSRPRRWTTRSRSPRRCWRCRWT